jgi:hypothetical protein
MSHREDRTAGCVLDEALSGTEAIGGGMMKSPVFPARIRLLTLAITSVSLAAAPAGAQEVGNILRRQTVYWPRWEVPGTRPTAASLRASGVCDAMVRSGARFFHHVDVDADGRADLVYSGPNTLCDRGLEGESTTVYLSRGNQLVRVFQGHGRVVELSRAAPWQPLAFVLRSDGCCGEPQYDVTVHAPRRTRDGWSWEPVTRIAATSETLLPTTWLPVARPFTVQQDGYKLRVTPVVDDTSDDVLPDARGNARATYPRGSRGVALAERRGADGRTWWFVMMRAPEANAYRPPDGATLWQLGWMSARLLTADAVAPTGRVDHQPGPPAS